MKRWLLAALALDCLLPLGAGAQTTKAQYTNGDGSVSPGITIQCPDPNNAGKAIACGQTSTATSVKITDGTNTAAVKAASTAPTTADPALVVAISPNSFSAPTTTNDSSTVTTGGTFQAVAAASSSRLSVDFQNLSGNGDKCYIFFGTIGSATTNNSITVLDGQEYLRASGTIPGDAFNITCATNGDHFYAAVQ